MENYWTAQTSGGYKVGRDAGILPLTIVFQGRRGSERPQEGGLSLVSSFIPFGWKTP